MMRKITLWLLTVFSVIQVNAQLWTINSCSNLGSNTYGPMNSIATANATNRTAVIYPSSQLTGISGQQLTNMYFQRYSTTGTMAGTPNFKIYLKEVTSVDWGASALDWATEIATATLVYDSDPATIVGSASGWKGFPLMGSFTYTGTNNLAVFMEYTNTIASTAITWNYEYTAPCIDTANSNTTKYTNNTTGTPGTSLTSTNYRRPLIGFDYPVSCPAPTGLIVSNVTNSQAEIGWTDASGSNWIIEYGSVGFTPGTGTQVPTSTNPHILTPLTANTSYDVYVQTDCGGGDLSVLVGPVSFTTLCNSFTAPWTYDVESAATTTNSSIADCWSSNPTGTTTAFRWDVDGSGSTPTTGTGPSGANSGNNYFYTEASSGTTGAIAELVSPLVDVSGLSDPTIQFYYHMFGVNIGELHVDIYDGASWNNDMFVLTGQQQTADTDSWTLAVVSLSSLTITGDVQARFRGIRGAGIAGDISIDDISFVEAPSCFDPINLAVNNITATSFDLDWVDASGGNQFDFYYVVQVAGTGLPVVNPENYYDYSSGTPFTITCINSADCANTLLTANTDYEVYVRADCNSNWAGPVNFTTACSAYVAPWTYNVETAATTTNSSIGDCWSSNPTGTTAAFRWDVDGVGSTPSGSTGPSGANSGNNYFYTEASSGTTGAVAELYTPMVDISGLTNPTVQFYYHMYGATMGDLHVDVFDGSVWTDDVDVITGQQQTAATDPWALRVVSLSAFSGTIQVRFRGIRSTDFYGDMSLDDISFDEAPSCYDPINLAVSNIMANSFDLEWVDASGGSQFDFYYVVQPAGTGLPVVNPENYYDISSGTPFTVTCINSADCANTLLTSSTDYEVYVRADCSSNFVGPISFTTACDVFTVPELEDFTVFLPNCWDKAFGGDLTAGPSTFDTGGWVADGFANAGTTGAIKNNIYTTGANDWVLSPLYAIPATGWELKFDAAATQFASTNSPTTPWESDDFIEVLVSNGMDNWSVLFTYNDTNMPSNTGSSNVIDLDAYAGQNVRFAFRAVEGATNGSADIDFSIDNFEIRLTPSCPEPSNVTVNNITDTSADITWTATTGNYEYVLDNNSADPAGPGTAISGESYNATPLSPSTTYYFHVRSDCGSAWVTVSFTTLATPPANDECDNAITLTVNADLNCGVVTSATNFGATASSQVDDVTGTPNNDVWFSFVATSTSHQVSLLNVVAASGTSTDMGMGVYDATGGCLSLVFVADSDPNSLSLTGLTIGNTYLVRVYNWGTNAANTDNFDVCVGTPPPPPANDECDNAIALTVNADYNCGVVTSGTNVSATASSQVDDVTGTPNNDVWFSFVATQTAHRVSLLNVVAATGTSTDMGMGVYDATGGCSSLVFHADSDPNTLNLTGLTIGNTYLVRVYNWGSNAANTDNFDVCVGTDPTLSTNSFDVNSFVAYPNPVKDILTLEYSSDISKVNVVNMLGQVVLTKTIDATIAKVDMTQLATGTYLVNVTSGDVQKTIKVVKQ